LVSRAVERGRSTLASWQNTELKGRPETGWLAGVIFSGDGWRPPGHLLFGGRQFSRRLSASGAGGRDPEPAPTIRSRAAAI